MIMEQEAANAIKLLRELIAIPSFSREEEEVANHLESYLKGRGFVPRRTGNNIWIDSGERRPDKPTLLLNSHLDTVRPSSGWTRDPFSPDIINGKLYGLGSNDAGGCLVSLLHTFFLLAQNEQPYNLIFAASVEEEVSGQNGAALLIKELGKIDLAVVGEPTKMEMAIAEKGLMVLDCTAHGQSGHAAREEGINAIYKAMKDIEWFRNYQFEKVSPLLGAVKMSVTQIEAGSQHNVVPDACKFVVDVRTNEWYQNKEAFRIIDSHVECEVKERSFRLNSSGIALDDPLVKRGIELGHAYFGSPTTSDQALMPFTTLKMGPGDSARSHSSDEFILVDEISKGIHDYYQLLNNLAL